MLRFLSFRRFLSGVPRRVAHTLATCAIVAAGLLALPWPGRGASAPLAPRTLTVNFTPPSGTHFTTATPAIQVSGCETFYQITDAIISVNQSGGTYTEQPPGSGNCSTSYSRRYDVTGPPLVPGENTVTANIFNSNGDGKLGTATYYYDAYAIAVSGGFDPTVAPGASGSVQFTVNNTGGLTADADLAISCPSLASCTLVGDDPRSVPTQQNVSVTVNFTAASVDGDADITLTATYVQSPTTTANASVTVHVRTPVDHVGIQPAPVQVGVNQSAGLTATAYDAQNNPLAGRAISWSVGSSAIATVSPSTGTSTSLTGQSTGTTTVMASSEGKSGSANVYVGAATGPTVSFAPPSNTHFTSAAQALTVRGCHATLPVTDAILTLNGGGLTYTRTEGSTACSGGFGAEFHTNVTLTQAQNTLAATVSVDNGIASTGASATYFLDQYAITVTPHGGTGPTLLPGVTDTLQFTVKNTGTSTGTIAVAANCPAEFTCAVLGSTTFSLSSQQQRLVDVQFTAGGSAGARTLGLTATYQAPGSGSDQGTYTVTVGTPPPVVANVNVVLSAATIAPAAHTTATATLFDAGGAPVTGQSVTWSSSAPSVATATSTGALTGDVAGVATGSAWIRAVAANG